MNMPILTRFARLSAGYTALACIAATTLVALLALVLVDPAPADHDDSIHFPAESMAYGSFARVVSDPSAFGGEALRYADAGTATRSVTLSAEGERIVLRARNATSSSSQSSVGLRVTVDGVAVGERLITSTSYDYYSFNARVPVGTHKLGVNGYSLDGPDKLNLDNVSIVPAPDADSDGVADASDNCPDAANRDQRDLDGDGLGDACDSDRDGDGFENAYDNEPDIANPDQTDLDGDKIGDFADTDKDGDGIINHLDPDPKDPTVPNQGGGMPNDCDTVITTSNDIDGAVNADPRASATKFCLAPGTHTASDTVILRDGDSLTGPIGAQAAFGPATYGLPEANIVGQSTDKVVSADGSNITIEWVDVSGGDGRIDASRDSSTCPSSNLASGCPVVGTGVGIALGQSDGSTTVENVRVHHNDGAGIAGAKGRITNSEFFQNTLDPAFLGVVGSAIKGITEFEAAHNYVHDEQGNGIWHDHSLSGAGNDPAMTTNPGGGTWLHDNLVVDNGRWGLRFEYSPRDAEEGEHLPTPTFLAENNRLAGNGSGGASHRDAQNGSWRTNTFGPQTIGGISFAGNSGGRALVISDSGRSDRTDLWNASARYNTLNGETIKDCNAANTICSSNTP